MRNLISLIFIFISFNLISQDIQLTLSDKQVVNNQWIFTLSMTVINVQGGNWGAMNIRNNIEVPSGVEIDYATSIVTPLSTQIFNATVTTFPGGQVAGTAKLSINFERNTTVPNIGVGTTVSLGFFTINFTNNIPGANLITPRPFASSGTGTSFWVDKDDVNADRRPFSLFLQQPLPIKLSLFDVVKYDATSAKIDWKSAKEVNSDFFDLERSEDGVSWTQVTTIKAAGNTSNTQEYSYIDSNLPGTRTSNKIFYYRLRMVDLDGSFAYSDVRGVNFTRSKAEEYLTVYPSPTANRLNIDMSSFTLDNGDISLEIYDQLGKRVMTKDIIGTGIELIDVSDLPASVYVLKVTQDIKIHTKQFVKID